MLIRFVDGRLREVSFVVGAKLIASGKAQACASAGPREVK